MARSSCKQDCWFQFIKSRWLVGCLDATSLVFMWISHNWFFEAQARNYYCRKLGYFNRKIRNLQHTRLVNYHCGIAKYVIFYLRFQPSLVSEAEKPNLRSQTRNHSWLPCAQPLLQLPRLQTKACSVDTLKTLKKRWLFWNMDIFLKISVKIWHCPEKMTQ